jgi:hypothetical protein
MRRILVTMAVCVLGGGCATVVQKKAEQQSGLTPGFRDLRWGQAPTKNMHRLNVKANMVVYFRTEDNRRVGGLDAGLLHYLFYENRLCRVEVKWGALTRAEANSVVAALSRHWGPVADSSVFSGFGTFRWGAPTERTEAHLSYLVEQESTGGLFVKDHLTSLIAYEPTCNNRAINARDV